MEEKIINFLDYIGELEDPRIERGKLHKMPEILFLTLMGIICGCEGWIDVELFGEIQIEVLRKYLPYKNGIPSDDTLRRFFRNLDPEAFSRVFLNWVKDIVLSRSRREDGVELKTVAIDGKTMRRSFDYDGNNDQKAIHLVSAYATDLRLVLCQKKVDEKSNEITAIPKLLEVIDICDSIVTIDAMGCQKKIAQQIIDKKADYLLAVKANQPELFNDIKTFFEIESKNNFKDVVYDSFTTIEKGHGRIEIRTCTTTDQIQWLRELHGWTSLKSIASIVSKRYIKGITTTETRYYITSSSASAKRTLHAARSHWSIENSLHWILDVSFNDDQSRIRKGYAPQNIAVIKSAALNLLKSAQPLMGMRISIKGLRKAAGWNSTTLDLIVNQILMR